MGLFTWLFGKKKSECEKVDELQRHFCEEKPKKYKKTGTNQNKKINPSNQITIEDIVDDLVPADEQEIEDISNETDLKKVKVKGYSGAFDIKRSRDGRFVFNLVASNKMTVATSRVYSSANAAIGGIGSVVLNAERANVEDQTLKQSVRQPFPKWEIYIDKEGKFRFRLRASNGTTILRSQGYTQKTACKNGIDSVIRHAKSAKIDKTYLNKD